MAEEKRLLVVDDEGDICDFVKSFFEERDYRVFTALNGNEAISIVRKEKPTLILLDIKMKFMDGITVLRHIKEIDSEIKVIMVTALEDQEKMEEAYKYGAIDYITKPLVLSNLEQAVMRNL
ncbi:response regulator [Candidatus Omnitrophota bacterium]